MHRHGAALFCFLAAAPAAWAEPDPRPSGWEFGFRTGVSIPLASADSTDQMSDLVGVQFPFWFDAGYRLGDGMVFLGATARWTLGSYKQGGVCDVSGVSCWSRDLVVGGELIVHLGRYARIDPWLGFGFGYEWLTVGASGSGGQATVTLSGWEFANVQLGVDFALGRWVRVGPFISTAIGEYAKVSTSVTDGTLDIGNKAIHVWLTIGLRIAVLP